MGRRTENLLLEDAKEQGLTGIRVDIRGGAGYTSGHDAGDLIIGRSRHLKTKGEQHPDGFETLSDLYVVEEKYSAAESFKYIQEDGEKFDAMIEFAESIGATPVLAVRWSSERDWSPGAVHYLVDARDVERTDTGNLNVKPETAGDEYETPESFFEQV